MFLSLQTSQNCLLLKKCGTDFERSQSFCPCIDTSIIPEGWKFRKSPEETFVAWMLRIGGYSGEAYVYEWLHGHRLWACLRLGKVRFYMVLTDGSNMVQKEVVYDHTMSENLSVKTRRPTKRNLLNHLSVIILQVPI